MCFINSIEECIVCCIDVCGQVAKTEPSEKDKWNRMCISQANIPKNSICATMWLLRACTTVCTAHKHVYTHTYAVYTPHVYAAFSSLCECVCACVFVRESVSLMYFVFRDTLAFLEHVVLCGFMSLLRYSHFSAFISLPLSLRVALAAFSEYFSLIRFLSAQTSFLILFFSHYTIYNNSDAIVFYL